MSAVTTILLSTAWLFGPLDSGTAELRLGGGFAQADTARTNAQLSFSDSFLQAGAAVGISNELWIEIGLPQHWTRQSYQGRLFFDRSGVGDIHLGLGYQLGRDGHGGIAFDVAGGSPDAGPGDRFPELSDQFAEIGRSSPRLSAFGGYVHRTSTWRMAARGHLAFTSDDDDVTVGLTLYSLYEPGVDWFSFGPAVAGQWSALGGQPAYIQIRLVERIGKARGWSFELGGFTHIYTEETEDSTGLTGMIVWRG